MASAEIVLVCGLKVRLGCQDRLCVNSDADSSVARGGGAQGGYSPLHWHVDQNAEWEKHCVFSTFETVLSIGVD